MQYFTENFDPREYEGLMDLSDNGDITLMCHKKTKKLIIRKSVKKVNIGLYRQLINIRHKNLVHLMGIEDYADGYYAYEEYINGRTLAQVLQDNNGRVPEEKAVDYIEQLCAVVRVLHEQKPIIIHRNIKPSNVMLSADGVIKLIDFDASKDFTPDEKRDTELIGTFNYAAPEQYGFASSDPRTDIYTIGILFHELITGAKPNEIGLPYKGKYEKIIKKCIEIDPKKRYQHV